MVDWKRLRPECDLVQGEADFAEELAAKSGTLPFVPGSCLVDIILG